MEKELYTRLIDAAQGNAPADTVIKNVTMLIVTTGEWVRGDIAIAHGHVVGAGAEHYEGKRTVDGTGLFAVPGFIDSHVHVESSHTLPFAFEEAVLPHGTTTAICDPHELANVCGVDGIRFFLECAKRMRLDLIVQMSSCVPATAMETSGAALTAADLAALKAHPRTGGLAEVMNVPGILHKDPELLAKLAAFADRVIDGHAPLTAGYELNAYCSCGIANDHECSSVKEALDRIRRGMTVLIRGGSAASSHKTLASVITPQNVDFTALCTDDRNVLDILRCGHIDALIRNLIAEGAAPELVYRAASLSAARAFHLYDRGMLAPGKIADVVLLEDVRQCRIRSVFKKGVEVGEFSRSAAMPDYSFALHSIRRKPLDAEDFKIFSQRQATPVIGIIPGELTTEHLTLNLPVDKNGEKHPTPEQDVAKLCVVARHGSNENIGKGFVRGFGMRRGAVASSVGHDSHNLCVAGTDDGDMATAVNALIESGGGYAVVREGRLLASVALPVGGLMSEKSFSGLAEELKRLDVALREIGCQLPDPLMQLAFLSLPVIPFLKITDKGVFDTEKFSFVEI